MKTYEEMAKYVLEVRDEHDKKKKHRIAAAKRVIPAAAGAFCAFIIGFGIFKGYNRPDTLPVHDNIIESETTSAQVTTLTQTTNKSGTALTTAAASAEKSTSKTAVSETKATTVKTEVTSVTSSNQTSAVTSSAAEHTTAVTSVTASTTAPTTTYTTVTTLETTTTAIGGGGGLSGDSQHDFPGGMGGGSAGGEGNGGYAGGATGGGAGGDGNGGYAGGGYAGGGTGGSGGTEEERWSQLTINHRYYYAFIDGYEDVYVNGYMISSDIVGSWIGEAEMESQTFIDGYIKKCSAEVYSINGYSDKEVVAIKFKGHDEYYLYCKINTDIYELMKKIPPHQ